ncbi:MAG: hypothetical protein KatS3mg069_2392 [Meiothermus sp.]|jgi:excisionase family DNA binding protein|nr:MAG: hypothetical protein KatS3mg069_2392 [Meiothermus sp.]
MEILGVSRDTVEQELRSGRLACKRLGKRRVAIPFLALKTYLETFDQYELQEVKDALPWD